MDIIAAKRRLMEEEGLVLHAYKDHLGYLTIGYGRLIDKRRGGGITKEEAEYLLLNDCRRVEQQIYAKYPWWVKLPEPAQLAIFDMTFNMGPSFLTDWPNTWEAIGHQLWGKVIHNIKKSKYAQQVPNRAARNIELFRQCTGETQYA